jgi:hypothetical protein
LYFIKVEGGVGVNESLNKGDIIITEDGRTASYSCKRVLHLPIFSVVSNDIGDEADGTPS